MDWNGCICIGWVKANNDTTWTVCRYPLKRVNVAFRSSKHNTRGSGCHVYDCRSNEIDLSNDTVLSRVSKLLGLTFAPIIHWNDLFEQSASISCIKNEVHSCAHLLFICDCYYYNTPSWQVINNNLLNEEKCLGWIKQHASAHATSSTLYNWQPFSVIGVCHHSDLEEKEHAWCLPFFFFLDSGDLQIVQYQNWFVLRGTKSCWKLKRDQYHMLIWLILGSWCLIWYLSKWDIFLT